MGVDYYNCNCCGVIFADCNGYGRCCNCEEELFCNDCRYSERKKVLILDGYSCDCCQGAKIDDEHDPNCRKDNCCLIKGCLICSNCEAFEPKTLLEKGELKIIEYKECIIVYESGEELLKYNKG